MDRDELVAAALGLRDTCVQVALLVGGKVEAGPVLVAGSSGAVGAELDDRVRLTLRITCDAGAKSVTFTNPALAR